MNSVHPERRTEGTESKGQLAADVRVAKLSSGDAVDSDGSSFDYGLRLRSGSLRSAHRERWGWGVALLLTASLVLAGCGIRGTPHAPAQPSPSGETPHGGESGPTTNPTQRGPFTPLPPPDAGGAQPMPLPMPDAGSADAGSR